MRFPTYSVIFDYDLDLPENNEFIIKNIQYFLKISKIYINFYIYAISKNHLYFDEKISSIKTQIKDKSNYEIKILSSIEEKNNIIQNNYKKNYKVILCDHNMLLSYYFFNNLHNFFSYTKNISLPLMHYKYSFTNYSYKEKNYKIKKFILSEDQFYQGSNSIPDWDERLYLDYENFQKMDGKLPIISPSPLLHNWGQYKTIILSSPEQEDVKIYNSKFCIHKFENISI